MKTPYGAIMTIAAILLVATGCGGARENVGTVIGGVAGAVVGNQFGSGSGKTAATALGAVIGAVAGREIGAHLDAQSQTMAGEATVQALDSNAGADAPITWENTGNQDGPAKGTSHVTRQGRDVDGNLCREYQSTVVIGGKERAAYGQACRDANGDWVIRS